MRTIEMTRFAWSDLRWRRKAAYLTAMAVFVAAGTVLTFGHLGSSMHEAVAASLDETRTRRVIAEVPGLSGAGRRFTPEFVQEMTRWSGVEFAFPCVEIGVRVDAGTVSSQFAEGTVPGDPLFRPSRMLWGRGVDGTSSGEVVLGESLFHRLGGSVLPDGPRPRTLRIEVERTSGGATQSRSLEAAVVGVSRDQVGDRIHLPIDTLRALDEWCAGKADHLPWEDDEGGGTSYPAVYVYVPEARLSNFAADREQLRIRAEPLGSFTATRPDDGIWVDLGTADPQVEQVGDREGLEVHGIEEIDVRQGNSTVRMVALAPDDPRWQASPSGAAPEFGTVLARAPAVGESTRVDGVTLRVAASGVDLPVAGDLVCTRETLRWIRFDPEERQVLEDVLWVETDLADLSRGLGQIVFSSPVAVPRPLQFGVLPAAPAPGTALSDPDPDSMADRAGAARSPAAGVAGGKWAVVYGGPREKWPSFATGQMAGRPAKEFRVLRAELHLAGTSRNVLCAEDAEGTGGTDGRYALVDPGGVLPCRGSVGDTAFSVQVEIFPSPEAPQGIVILDNQTFRELAWSRSGGGSGPAGIRRLHAVFSDSAVCRRFREGSGAGLRPLVPVQDVRVSRYRITDPQAADGAVSQKLFGWISAARASVCAAVPELTAEGAVGGEQIAFTGTVPNDPARFIDPLVHGTWVRTADAREAVLAEPVARGLFPGERPQDLIGRQMEVRFARERGGAPVEEIVVPLRVVGIAGGESSFLGLDDVRRIRLWMAGRLVYRDDRGAFERPVDIYRAAGNLRCVVYARTSKNVRPLVARLEEEGYRVVHRLADLEQVDRIGTAILIFVLIVLAAAGLPATAMSWYVTSLNVSEKTREIGLLRILGLSRRGALAIFLIEGVTLGVMAFAAAFLFSIFLCGWLGAVLEGVLSLEGRLADEAFLTSSRWPLYLTAMVVSTVFSTLSVAVAGWRACRKPVNDALGRTN